MDNFNYQCTSIDPIGKNRPRSESDGLQPRFRPVLENLHVATRFRRLADTAWSPSRKIPCPGADRHRKDA